MLVAREPGAEFPELELYPENTAERESYLLKKGGGCTRRCFEFRVVLTNGVSQYFEWCKPYEEIFDNDNSGNGSCVILCHYSIAHWHSADKGSVHLYGHIHSLRDSRPFDEYRELMRQ